MRCRSCPHKAHMGICTGRSGGTAYACGCCTITVPSDEVQSLRRDVERLTRERDEAEKREQWARSEVHELRSERDAAYAASVRSDEVHAETVRAVRGRAEKAEAERDEARAMAERLNEHAEAVAVDFLNFHGRIVALEAERDAEKRRADNTATIYGMKVKTLAETLEALTAARAQVERLRGVLRAVVLLHDEGATRATAKKLSDDYESLHASHGGNTLTKVVYENARAALADATVRNDDPDAPNERR